MIQLTLIALSVIIISCGQSNKSTEHEAGTRNTEENVDEHSGKNISPQLKDSADRLKVDTVSSSTDVQNKKENDTLRK